MCIAVSKSLDPIRNMEAESTDEGKVNGQGRLLVVMRHSTQVQFGSHDWVLSLYDKMRVKKIHHQEGKSQLKCITTIHRAFKKGPNRAWIYEPTESMPPFVPARTMEHHALDPPLDRKGLHFARENAEALVRNFPMLRKEGIPLWSNHMRKAATNHRTLIGITNSVQIAKAVGRFAKVRVENHLFECTGFYPPPKAAQMKFLTLTESSAFGIPVDPRYHGFASPLSKNESHSETLIRSAALLQKLIANVPASSHLILVGHAGSHFALGAPLEAATTDGGNWWGVGNEEHGQTNNNMVGEDIKEAGNDDGYNAKDEGCLGMTRRRESRSSTSLGFTPQAPLSPLSSSSPTGSFSSFFGARCLVKPQPCDKRKFLEIQRLHYGTGQPLASCYTSIFKGSTAGPLWSRIFAGVPSKDLTTRRKNEGDNTQNHGDTITVMGKEKQQQQQQQHDEIEGKRTFPWEKSLPAGSPSLDLQRRKKRQQQQQGAIEDRIGSIRGGNRNPTRQKSPLSSRKRQMRRRRREEEEEEEEEGMAAKLKLHAVHTAQKKGNGAEDDLYKKQQPLWSSSTSPQAAGAGLGNDEYQQQQEEEEEEEEEEEDELPPGSPLIARRKNNKRYRAVGARLLPCDGPLQHSHEGIDGDSKHCLVPSAPPPPPIDDFGVFSEEGEAISKSMMQKPSGLMDVRDLFGKWILAIVRNCKVVARSSSISKSMMSDSSSSSSTNDFVDVHYVGWSRSYDEIINWKTEQDRFAPKSRFSKRVIVNLDASLPLGIALQRENKDTDREDGGSLSAAGARGGRQQGAGHESSPRAAMNQQQQDEKKRKITKDRRILSSSCPSMFASTAAAAARRKIIPTRIMSVTPGSQADIQGIEAGYEIICIKPFGGVEVTPENPAHASTILETVKELQVDNQKKNKKDTLDDGYHDGGGGDFNDGGDQLNLWCKHVFCAKGGLAVMAGKPKDSVSICQGRTRHDKATEAQTYEIELDCRNSDQDRCQ
eukprot:jgi/Bigna1/66059/fgenesh1_pg.1_\